jgi:hypothetical protein
MKAVTEISTTDLAEHPIWEYCDSTNEDGYALVPLTDLPVDSLDQRIVGTRVTLGNGTMLWAVLSGGDLSLPTFVEEDSGLILYVDDERVSLGSAWERELPGYGAGDLCRKLGLTMEEVFPITFDVSHLVTGDRPALRGQFTK